MPIKRTKHFDMADAVNRATDKFLTEAGLLIEGQAKANAPVRTGQLRNSINSRVEGDKAIVGTNVEYATHVEYGARNQKAQPYMRPALDKNRKNIVRLYRENMKEATRGR